MPSLHASFWSLVFLIAATASAMPEDKPSAQAVARIIAWGHFADYDAAPRLPNGHVDADALVKRLKELGVNTYYWLVLPSFSWDDLKAFLPKAAKAGIEVWVYLVPPSESPPRWGTRPIEPFGLDYSGWAEGIARLSLEHPNVTAWVIDDFYANHDFFNPAYLREIRARAKAINPRLAFLPLMYFAELQPEFLNEYRPLIDGAVVAYLQDREEIERTWALLNDGTILPISELSCPSHTRSRPGDYAMASQSVEVLPADRYEVSFSERDGFSGKTAGYHFKQLLLDGNVVWEQDVAGGPDGWRNVVVDVTRQVRGKARTTLSFRLLDKKGVGNFPLNWRVRALRAENLKLTADLSQPQKWTAHRLGALETGFGSIPTPGQRRFHVPFVSMTAGDATEFRMRHGDPASPERIAGQLRLSLQAWREGKCDGVVTYCLDKRPQSPAFPGVQALFHEFAVPGRKAP